jgi:hypothetical protein
MGISRTSPAPRSPSVCHNSLCTMLSTSSKSLTLTQTDEIGAHYTYEKRVTKSAAPSRVSPTSGNRPFQNNDFSF